MYTKVLATAALCGLWYAPADAQSGIGTAAPASTLHVTESTAGTDGELILQHAVGNQSTGLRLIEGGTTQDFGFHLRYDGVGNRFSIGRHNGDRYLTADRNSGHFAFGTNAVPTAADLVWIGGQARISSDNPLYLGDDDDVSISRYTLGGFNDLELVNNDGEAHVHADQLQVTGPPLPGRLEPVARFDATTQRVGLGGLAAGFLVTPTNTLHVVPRNGDRPLRIEGLTTTPNNGNRYRILIADDDGVVYVSSRTTQGNPRSPEPVAAAGVAPTPGTNVLSDLRDELDALRAEVERLRATVQALTPARLPRDPDQAHDQHAHAHGSDRGQAEQPDLATAEDVFD